MFFPPTQIHYAESISVPDPSELLSPLEHLAHTLPWFAGMIKEASLSKRKKN
jgi:hypothetical protein